MTARVSSIHAPVYRSRRLQLRRHRHLDDGSCEYESCAGCTDPAALNYDPTATIDDGSCFYTAVLGCVDPTACNFDETANTDDGSCEYDTCAGCTDVNAYNYDATATLDDGSCEYESCAGCTDPEACNFDATATLDDGSCDYETCAGCTDEAALNYDPDATIDDGSCVYDCEYPILFLSTFCEEGESDVFYIELDIDDLGNGAPYAITNSYNSDSFEVGFNGSVEIGPFPNDEQVLVTITSIPFPNCLLTSPLLSDNCTDDSIEETDAAPAIFPNPTSDHVYVQSPVSAAGTLYCTALTDALWHKPACRPKLEQTRFGPCPLTSLQDSTPCV